MTPPANFGHASASLSGALIRPSDLRDLAGSFPPSNTSSPPTHRSRARRRRRLSVHLATIANRDGRKSKIGRKETGSQFAVCDRGSASPCHVRACPAIAFRLRRSRRRTSRHGGAGPNLRSAAAVIRIARRREAYRYNQCAAGKFLPARRGALRPTNKPRSCSFRPSTSSCATLSRSPCRPSTRRTAT